MKQDIKISVSQMLYLIIHRKFSHSCFNLESEYSSIGYITQEPDT
jgi:hypothetical protein